MTSVIFNCVLHPVASVRMTEPAADGPLAIAVNVCLSFFFEAPLAAVNEPSRAHPRWDTRSSEAAESLVCHAPEKSWHARATRFHPSWDPSLELWLVVGCHALTGEIKYFLSNAPATEDVARLLSVAFSRWHIERIFEDLLGEKRPDLLHGV